MILSRGTMDSTVSKVSTFKIPKMLLMTIFVAAATLSIKAAYDLTIHSDLFPGWFVPSFTVAVSILIAVSLYFVLQVWKRQNSAPLISSRQSILLWILMLLSFVCTTSVHGFYPFRTDLLSFLPALDPVLKLNFVIAAVGLLVCVALAGFYIFGQVKLPAVIGLMIVSLLMLIPNDNCANPFNYWWIEKIGASPLMYVPNVYAALFVTSGIYGARPKSAIFLTMGICLASLVLGLGHQFRIIW